MPPLNVWLWLIKSKLAGGMEMTDSRGSAQWILFIAESGEMVCVIGTE